MDYKVDALGHRLERTADNNGDSVIDITERFGYDRGNMWAHLDGSNNLTFRRIFGDGIDTPVARVSGAGTAVWYLTDYQNSVIGLVNSSGTSLGSITYDGFGNILTDTTGASGDHYKWTGREWDALIQLQYNRARYYDPAIGKWTSMDPIGFTAGDANLYRYVGNGPTNWIDPTGLDAYLLNDTNGAKGNGHSGVLVGNDKDGWVYLATYPGPPVDKGNEILFFDKLADAMKSEALKRYNEYLLWRNSLREDQVGKAVACYEYRTRKWTVGYNCVDSAATVINSTKTRLTIVKGSPGNYVIGFGTKTGLGNKTVDFNRSEADGSGTWPAKK